MEFFKTIDIKTYIAILALILSIFSIGLTLLEKKKSAKEKQRLKLLDLRRRIDELENIEFRFQTTIELDTMKYPADTFGTIKTSFLQDLKKLKELIVFSSYCVDGLKELDDLFLETLEKSILKGEATVSNYKLAYDSMIEGLILIEGMTKEERAMHRKSLENPDKV